MIGRIFKRAAGVALFALTLCLMLGAVASAAEAPKLAPPPEGAPVALTYIFYALSAIVPLVLGYLKLRIDKSDAEESEKKAKKDAIDSLWNGVASTYLAYVKEAKAGEKFDEKVARAHAIEAAKDMAGPAARAVYEAWGKSKLTALVHRFANRQGADRASDKPPAETAPTE